MTYKGNKPSRTSACLFWEDDTLETILRPDDEPADTSILAAFVGETTEAVPLAFPFRFDQFSPTQSDISTERSKQARSLGVVATIY